MAEMHVKTFPLLEGGMTKAVPLNGGDVVGFKPNGIDFAKVYLDATVDGNTWMSVKGSLVIFLNVDIQTDEFMIFNTPVGGFRAVRFRFEDADDQPVVPQEGDSLTLMFRDGSGQRTTTLSIDPETRQTQPLALDGGTISAWRTTGITTANLIHVEMSFDRTNWYHIINSSAGQLNWSWSQVAGQVLRLTSRLTGVPYVRFTVWYNGGIDDVVLGDDPTLILYWA